MRNKYHHIVLLLLLLTGVTSCVNYRKLIVDEVVLKDGNSHTGKLVYSDTSAVKIQKIDESICVIHWTTIDTIQGKRLKTFFLGANMGAYNVPYFSVFRNEKITAKGFGMQYKAGWAYRGNRLGYMHLSFVPAKPYNVTKFGLGLQRYIQEYTYLSKHSFFWGGEINLMNAKYNNGSQVTLEPFGGYEMKVLETIRVHSKLGLQLNVANKNNNVGINLTIGVHFLKKDYKQHYEYLNKERSLPMR